MEPFSIHKRLKSFVYAGAGIRKLITREHNAWIHCCAIIVTTTAGLAVGLSRMEWVAVVLCFAIVLAAEGFNTAIERLVDLVSPERHPVAGDVKDIAAGAVLICAIGAFITALFIFLPHFL